MTIEIRETIVEETASATIVSLLVSDVPKEQLGNARFRFELVTRLPAYRKPLLAQLQREAILQATDALGRLRDALAQNLPSSTSARPEEI
jgi:hypothetical protein